MGRFDARDDAQRAATHATVFDVDVEDSLAPGVGAGGDAVVDGGAEELLEIVGGLDVRRSPRTGSPRGAFCMMGVCQECLVRIDGMLRQACLTPVEDGMRVESVDPGGAA